MKSSVAFDNLRKPMGKKSNNRKTSMNDKIAQKGTVEEILHSYFPIRNSNGANLNLLYSFKIDCKLQISQICILYRYFR